jgi:hypothetical protein
MKVTWKLYVTMGVVVLLCLFGYSLGTAYYPVTWMKWQLGLGQEPAVVSAEAQLAGEMTAPPEYWIFRVEGSQRTEVEYERGALTSILPASSEEWVEVYCTAPFEAVSFPWEEWESLSKATLKVQFWKRGGWDEGTSWTLGRVPVGPPEARGRELAWGCNKWAEGNQRAVPGHQYVTAYALRLTVSEDVPVTQLHTTFRSCVPEWNTEHPRWKVLWVEKVNACDSKGFSGWSGKMIQVWVVDEKGVPQQGVEVRFGIEPSFGVAYDRPDFGGLTSRFGLVEWDSLGSPTRYQIWMGDDEAPLVTNVRADLGNEYCQRGAYPSWRPGCWPGFHPYKLKVQARGD